MSNTDHGSSRIFRRSDWRYHLPKDSATQCGYTCIAIQKNSWINIHEWFGCNFPTWNIRNVWRTRGDGHHYDVTSKCCGVTITTRSVEWTLFISEIRVFFCCFQELSCFKKIQMVTQIKCGIKAKRHGQSVLRILSWCWWDLVTSANQIAQNGSCDRSRIHNHDLGGTGVWPGKK